MYGYGVCALVVIGVFRVHFLSHRQAAYTRNQTSVSNCRLCLGKGHRKNKNPAHISQHITPGWDTHKRLFFRAKLLLKYKVRDSLLRGVKTLCFLPADGLRIVIDGFFFVCKTVISRNIKLSKHTRTLVLMREVEAGRWTPQADSSVLSWPHLPSCAPQAPLHVFHATLKALPEATLAPGRRQPGQPQFFHYTSDCTCSLFWYQVSMIPATAFQNRLEKFPKCFLYKVNKWLQRSGGIFIFFSNLPIGRFLHVI